MRYVYRGPADAVLIDGLRIERDVPVELTGDLITRLRADATVRLEPAPEKKPEGKREE